MVDALVKAAQQTRSKVENVMARSSCPWENIPPCCSLQSEVAYRSAAAADDARKLK